MDTEAKMKGETEIHYLEKNAGYMRYAQFRAQGFIRRIWGGRSWMQNLIGQRLKQSGMEWSVRGANAIISSDPSLHLAARRLLGVPCVMIPHFLSQTLGCGQFAGLLRQSGSKKATGVDGVTKEESGRTSKRTSGSVW